MKVGIIGLGRMGEGMSRRMIKAGHEVWGYRNNYEKACEQYEAGYVSGVTTSLQSLFMQLNLTVSNTPVLVIFLVSSNLLSPQN